MKIGLYILIVLLTTSFIRNVPLKEKTILVIVAHPDDENMGGPVYAKYARLNYRVQFMIATDGKFGTRVTNIPEGDSLGNLGKLESICACKKLGVDTPIFLSLERLDTKIGTRAYLNDHKKLLAELKKYIEAIQPDILITFGPDGEYGHSEHIVVGATITELLLREGWVDKYPLYFIGWRKDQVTDNDELSYVDNRYLDYEIDYSVEDEKKSIEASKCYVTQFTQKELQDEEEGRLKDPLNMIPFRKFRVFEKGKVKHDFFPRE
ncbi:MAG: PIG-L family deacetylase [Chitinophagaceae bacterium]